MPDTQYELFQELDRHCVAVGMVAGTCLSAVAKKRASIAAEAERKNPVVLDVIEGRTSFVAIYDAYSHAFRGVRRFLPMAHDAERNERLHHYARIVPNVTHFLRRSLVATDNPVTCSVYGVVAALAVVTVWMYATHRDTAAEDALDAATLTLLVFLGGFGGFAAGVFAMLKYRTRDPRIIRAREAAAYMDLNYKCYRTFDDEAWAKFITLKTTSPQTELPEFVGTPAGPRAELRVPHDRPAAT